MCQLGHPGHVTVRYALRHSLTSIPTVIGIPIHSRSHQNIPLKARKFRGQFRKSHECEAACIPNVHKALSYFLGNYLFADSDRMVELVNRYAGWAASIQVRHDNTSSRHRNFLVTFHYIPQHKLTLSILWYERAKDNQGMITPCVSILLPHSIRVCSF